MCKYWNCGVWHTFGDANWRANVENITCEQALSDILQSMEYTLTEKSKTRSTITLTFNELEFVNLPSIIPLQIGNVRPTLTATLSCSIP